MSMYTLKPKLPLPKRRHAMWLTGILFSSSFLVLLANTSDALAESSLKQTINIGEKRTNEGAAAQKKVDKLSEKKRDLMAQYLGLSKTIDGLVLYNNLLSEQVNSQQNDINKLTASIDNVAVIERQIVPLAVRMIDSLETFISLDTPFLIQERTKRVATLKAMMTRPDVAVAEKVRKVFEAYQTENEYGRTIESYQGQLEIEGVKREVEFLRVGRIALLYKTNDGHFLGHWTGKQWQALDVTDYKRYVETGLKIAAKQEAPNLLTVPINVSTEVGDNK